MKGKDLQVDAGYSGLPAVPGTQHLHPGGERKNRSHYSLSY